MNKDKSQHKKGCDISSALFVSISYIVICFIIFIAYGDFVKAWNDIGSFLLIIGGIIGAYFLIKALFVYSKGIINNKSINKKQRNLIIIIILVFTAIFLIKIIICKNCLKSIDRKKFEIVEVEKIKIKPYEWKSILSSPEYYKKFGHSCKTYRFEIDEHLLNTKNSLMLKSYSYLDSAGYDLEYFAIENFKCFKLPSYVPNFGNLRTGNTIISLNDDDYSGKIKRPPKKLTVIIVLLKNKNTKQ